MDAGFRVVYSGNVRNALKELLLRAVSIDKEFGRAALKAVQAIDERLRRGPRDFGELRFHLSVMQLDTRVAVISPLAVQFAVHADEPLVFVTKHDLLSPPST